MPKRRPIDTHLRPIGVVRSPLRTRAAAPRLGTEGAPDAWLELDASVARGLGAIAAGDALIVITWAHAATCSRCIRAAT